MRAGKDYDNLIYLDDYVDTIEALPLELQRNFTLMRELDGYAKEMMDSVSKVAVDLIDNVLTMDPKERVEKLKELGERLTETLKRGEEKVALAKSTHDAVERHCNRLDVNLVKFEEEQTLGNMRITSHPGLEPSARSLRDGVEYSEKGNKRLDRDRKDLKGDKRVKKRKTARENGSPPSGSRSQALKEARAIKAQVDKPKSTFSGKHGKTKNSSASDMVDPNEPLYCYCQQVSYGEMVACDNGDCDIEWFHLACVDLKTVPKGKWYCSNCTSKMKGKQRK